MKWTLTISALLQCLTCLYSQRVAPGVPPQQYHDGHMPPQHQPPPQQYQQQHQQQQQFQHQPQAQFQQQQAPVQPGYQQPGPPQQAFQQQQQQQQPQLHHGHGGGHAHHGNPQVLNTQNLAHEKEHIQEHMDVPIDTSKMSEAELQFHYFKMHDADNNNKLDGCELIKSLIHWHEQGSKHEHTRQQQQPPVDEKIFSDDELTNLIDPILNMDDLNRDGFIDYPEFVRAQQKSQQQAAQQQAQGQH